MSILAHVRPLARLVILALPGYFAGSCVALLKLHFVNHFDFPWQFWIREPLGLALTCWITFVEMFHVER